MDLVQRPMNIIMSWNKSFLLPSILLYSNQSENKIIKLFNKGYQNKKSTVFPFTQKKDNTIPCNTYQP